MKMIQYQCMNLFLLWVYGCYLTMPYEKKYNSYDNDNDNLCSEGIPFFPHVIYDHVWLLQNNLLNFSETYQFVYSSSLQK